MHCLFEPFRLVEGRCQRELIAEVWENQWRVSSRGFALLEDAYETVQVMCQEDFHE